MRFIFNSINLFDDIVLEIRDGEENPIHQVIVPAIEQLTYIDFECSTTRFNLYLHPYEESDEATEADILNDSRVVKKAIYRKDSFNENEPNQDDIYKDAWKAEEAAMEDNEEVDSDEEHISILKKKSSGDSLDFSEAYKTVLIDVNSDVTEVFFFFTTIWQLYGIVIKALAKRSNAGLEYETNQYFERIVDLTEIESRYVEKRKRGRKNIIVIALITIAVLILIYERIDHSTNWMAGVLVGGFIAFGIEWIDLSAIKDAYNILSNKEVVMADETEEIVEEKEDLQDGINEDTN